MTVKTWPGKPYPLGATWLGNGVNFAIYAEHANAVDLCLFDNLDAPNERVRVRLREQTECIWHAFLPDARPGQLYGFRVYGPYDPPHGLRFNDSKLLLDPYAKSIAGQIKWCDEMFGYILGDAGEDLSRDSRDNAWAMPKSVIIDPAFDWGGDVRPNTPFSETVIYEMHVKGFTKLFSEIPERLRGTYAGLASQEAIGYLKNLGVTAVELLPIHTHLNDRPLVDRGLANYWGYNSIGFFSPHAQYSSNRAPGAEVVEFKGMIRNLHAAGLEVILDVVYNHTGEGNHLGPTVSFRGIDNPVYYRLLADDPRFYLDYTGTGNTVDTLTPRALQLVMDSLRYWATEMHADGFRFDLATALARDSSGFNKFHAFFKIIQQDPVLSQLKFIAEPWDVGDGGYQIGNFPLPWSEWNGKFRDAMRSYWKGDEGKLGEIAYRLTGSPDLYQHDGRAPTSTINIMTTHDGFTLNDVVSYNDKHNEANGENNQDGDNNNQSWNCGAEGLTDDPKINGLRRKQRRNFLTMLFLSQGVPMLLGGDEFGRTQNGNNNAYCQDNEISWFDWQRRDNELFEFTKRLIAFRKQHPVFRRPKFFQGKRIRGSEIKDVMWFNPGGNEMSDDEWNSPFARCLGMLVSGDADDVVDSRGEPVRDDIFLLLINAHYEAIPFVLPGEEKLEWELILDTEGGFLNKPERFSSGDDVDLKGRSTVLLRLTSGLQTQARHESWKKRPFEVKAASAEQERAG
ncbi:MAG: glycogen debranching protein GlgX [Verrucomicrobia bacterium]|nr:glycogen debranching protein GlgX [Verrucomicrobiota bacterium]